MSDSSDDSDYVLEEVDDDEEKDTKKRQKVEAEVELLQVFYHPFPPPLTSFVVGSPFG